MAQNKKHNNISKNILTLKAMDERLNKMQEAAEAKVRAELAADLEALKNVSAAKKSRISSLFSPAFMIFSAIVTNLHKIPLIGKLIKILSLWYGKSTWWHILVIIRKVIIITNALIGFYALIKISGFSFDNIGAGIACFGATYMETLRVLICKIFNWFYDFFDYRTPNPPTEPGGSWWFKSKPEKDPRWWGSRMFGWYGKDMMVADSITQPIIDLSKGQDFYNPFKARIIEEPRGSYFNPFNWSGWVWYTILGAVSIGCAYYGYKWVMNEANAGLLRDWPPFGNWWNPNRGDAAPAAPQPVVEVENPTPPAEPVAGLNADPNVAHVFDPDTGGFVPAAAVEGNRGFSRVSAAATALREGTGHVIGGVRDFMNPFNWFITSEQVAERHHNWLTSQVNSDILNKNLYPFTPNNPADTYGQKFYKAVFGETALEQRIREEARATVYQQWCIRHDLDDSILMGHNMADLGEDIARAVSPVWSATRDLQNQSALQQLPQTPTGDLGNSPWEGATSPKSVSSASSVEEILNDAATDINKAGGGAQDWGEVPKIRGVAAPVVAPQPVQVAPTSVATQLAQVVEQSPQGPQNAPQVSQNVPQGPQIVQQAPQIVPKAPQIISEVVTDVPQIPTKGPQIITDAPQNVPQLPQSIPQVPQVAPQNVSQEPQIVTVAPQITTDVSQTSTIVSQHSSNVTTGVATKGPQLATKAPQIITEAPQHISDVITDTASQSGSSIGSVTPTASAAMETGKVLEGVGQKLHTAAVRDGQGVTELAKSLSPLNIASASLLGKAEAAEIVRSVSPSPVTGGEAAATLISLPADDSLSWSINNFSEGAASYNVTSTNPVADGLGLFYEDLVNSITECKSSLDKGQLDLLDKLTQRVIAVKNTLTEQPQTLQEFERLLSQVKSAIPNIEKHIERSISSGKDDVDQLKFFRNFWSNIDQSLESIHPRTR